jgi:hypothetical protein
LQVGEEWLGGDGHVSTLLPVVPELTTASAHSVSLGLIMVFTGKREMER